jgi:hypothetical protein
MDLVHLCEQSFFGLNVYTPTSFVLSEVEVEWCKLGGYFLKTMLLALRLTHTKRETYKHREMILTDGKQKTKTTIA